MAQDPQGYPVQQYTNLDNDVILELLSDGTIVLINGTTMSNGTGSPEGVISALPGSWYIQTDAVAPNFWWQKQTGTGNTGWTLIGAGGVNLVTSVFGRAGVVVADANDYAAVDNVVVADTAGNGLTVNTNNNTVQLVSAGGLLALDDGGPAGFNLTNTANSAGIRNDAGSELLLNGGGSCSLTFLTDTVTLQCGAGFLELGVGGVAFELKGSLGGGTADFQSPDGDQITMAATFMFFTAPTIQLQAGTAAFGLADTGFSINDGNINSINSNASTNTVSILSANGGSLTVSTIIETNTLIKTTTLSVNTPAPAAGVTEVAFGNGHATTVGAAGGASALPATPTGYLIINVNGTDQKIPYYNV